MNIEVTDIYTTYHLILCRPLGHSWAWMWAKASWCESCSTFWRTNCCSWEGQPVSFCDTFQSLCITLWNYQKLSPIVNLWNHITLKLPGNWLSPDLKATWPGRKADKQLRNIFGKLITENYSGGSKCAFLESQWIRWKQAVAKGSTTTGYSTRTHQARVRNFFSI